MDLKEMYKQATEYEVLKKDFEKILQERLDFGFDSIYFRYAIAIDELALYKEKESFKEGKDFNKKLWADCQKQHFYNTLEQLTRAHQKNRD